MGWRKTLRRAHHASTRWVRGALALAAETRGRSKPDGLVGVGGGGGGGGAGICSGRVCSGKAKGSSAGQGKKSTPGQAKGSSAGQGRGSTNPSGQDPAEGQG